MTKSSEAILAAFVAEKTRAYSEYCDGMTKAELMTKAREWWGIATWCNSKNKVVAQSLTYAARERELGQWCKKHLGQAPYWQYIRAKNRIRDARLERLDNRNLCARRFEIYN